MKKAIGLLLTLALLLGCTLSASSEALGLVTLGEYPLVEEPVTVTAFGVVKSQIEDMATNNMTIWYEEKTGVHVEWECPPASEATTRMNLSLTSGDYPDFYFGMDLSTAQVWSYAQQGIALPLNDLIDSHMPNYKKLLEENESIRKAVTAPDGNIYTFIRTDGGLHVPAAQKLFIYTPWLEALDMEMPETPEEMKAYLIGVRDNDLNGNGDPSDEIPLVSSSGNLPVGFLLAPFELQPSKKLNVNDGEVYASFMTEAYRDGLRYIKDLYDEGLFSEDSFTLDSNSMKALTSRPDAMIVGASSGMMESVFGDMAALPSLWEDYAAVTPLLGQAGVRQTPYFDNAVVLNSFITTACEQPEVVAAWFDFWMSEEGGLVNGWGLEGVHYEWVDEPSIQGTTPSFKNFAQSDGMTNDTWYGTGCRYQSSKVRYAQTMAPDVLEYHYYSESLPYVDYFPAEYVARNTWFDEEQTEIVNLLESSILSFVNEAQAQFIVGTRDIETGWDSYLGELEAMQVSQWVQTYQDAYTAMMQ